MKNILIVTAHPSSHNVTKGIAEIYREEKEKQGVKVEILDLYRSKQLSFLSFEDANSPKEEGLKPYQQMIADTDEIVFVYPFWWGTMPAILKNWIDSVLTRGFAFEYNEKGRPVGLLQEKSVRIFSTCGAPRWLYLLNGIDRANRKIWKQTIVEFCGMKFEGYHLYGGIDTSGKSIDKVFGDVRKIAKG